MVEHSIIGWDIGGAHVKAALWSDGRIERVVLEACPLWRGMDYLCQAVNKVRALLPTPALHAMTMTGELVDLFSDREHGVSEIVRTMTSLLQDEPLRVYAGRRGFLRPEGLNPADCSNIASMNWLASADWAARQYSHALFVDIGSTTTDVLLIAEGVQAQGLTDYERLLSGELVYTGVVRTPVMALAQQVRFNGRMIGLMAEYFATMADVYRITGELDEAHDLNETADAGPKTQAASMRRLGRMIGYEYRPQDAMLWQAFAGQLRNLQKERILESCRQQMQRLDRLPTDFCVVGAGIGRFLVKEMAIVLNGRYVDFNHLLVQHKAADASIDGSDCAPAAAVACLAADLDQR